jgi:hypothetical protein
MLAVFFGVALPLLSLERFLASFAADHLSAYWPERGSGSRSRSLCHRGSRRSLLWRAKPARRMKRGMGTGFAASGSASSPPVYGW